MPSPFALVYVTTIGANYFLQLTAVRHSPADGALEGLGLLAMPNLRSIFWSLELAGHFWQEAALVLAAFVLTGGGVTRWIRGFAGLTFAGALLGVMVGLIGIDSFTSPLFLVAAIPSSIGCPLATGLFAVRFRHR